MINLLRNGDFSRALYEWTGTGTINRALGFPRLNCGALAVGQSLTQAQGISEQNLYTLHYFYQVATGATLTVGYGAAVNTHTGAPLSVWREGVLAFAVDVGDGNDSVSLSSAGGTAYVDTVTLIGGGLAKSRAEIAALVASRMAAIATDQGFSTTADSSGPEGDYTAAIDEALRAVGCMNSWGDPDVTLLLPAQINAVVESARASMLQRARADYALETDVTLGPRSESRSQIASSLDEILGGGGQGGGRVTMARLGNGDWPR